MATRQFGEAIEDGGIRSIYFFNGRQLTADDLQNEQTANTSALRRLGQAVGEGIAGGFEVSAGGTASEPLLIVEPGLAINRHGGVLRLTAQESLSLKPVVETSRATSTSNGFDTCSNLGPASYFSAEDVYLLTVSPAFTTKEFAPVMGMQQSAACNWRYQIKGVQFRLLKLNIAAGMLASTTLRNSLAYSFFGSADFAQLYLDLFAKMPAPYGRMDKNRPAELTDCDVPLALVHLAPTSGGIEIRFVDNWSVRRRITAPTMSGHLPIDPYASTSDTTKAPPNWARLCADRRAAEGEAMLGQFQEQIAKLVSTLPAGMLSNIAATDYFEYLPPLGLLPVGTGQFDEARFFVGQSLVQGGMISATHLAALIDKARHYDPIVLANSEPIHIYHVAETAIDTILFTSESFALYSLAVSGSGSSPGIPISTTGWALDINFVDVRGDATGEALDPNAIPHDLDVVFNYSVSHSGITDESMFTVVVMPTFLSTNTYGIPLSLFTAWFDLPAIEDYIQINQIRLGRDTPNPANLSVRFHMPEVGLLAAFLNIRFSLKVALYYSAVSWESDTQNFRIT